MATWDFSKAAAIITTSPTPILDALGSQFGVPQCMLDMAKDILNAFPSPVLNSIQAGIQNGKDKADELMKDIMRRIFLDTGIVEWDTDRGRFVFVSSSSNLGVEQDMLSNLNNLYGLGTILGFGAQAWVIGQQAMAQIDQIKSCIDKWKTFETLQKGPSAIADKIAGFQALDPTTGEVLEEYFAPPPATEAASLVFDSNKQSLENAVGFSQVCEKQILVIEEIQKARQKDPENNPEPAFWGDLVNTTPDSPWEGMTLTEALSGQTTFTILEGLEVDASGNPILPASALGEVFDPFTDVISASDVGPPISVRGQYLQSQTGMYYDAYGGGLNIPQVSSLSYDEDGNVIIGPLYDEDGNPIMGPLYDEDGNPILDSDGNPVIGQLTGPVPIWKEGCITGIVSAIYWDPDGNPYPGTGVPPDALRWLLDYNPNIGGKGQIVSWKTFNKWAETVFDINHIDESPAMQIYYEEDHFLQLILDQRNRDIYDLSSYITELKSQGYGEDSAEVFNQRQILLSKIADHDHKTKRRKKQIQVHVVLAPEHFPAIPGKIPINDLEGLDNAKLAIQQSLQETLMFNPGEVSGAVLPLCPTFIKSDIPQDKFTVEELMVPKIGVGAIITSDPYVSGTSGTTLSLNDHISTNGLVAIYNFLDADIVKPDSPEYFTINCITESTSEKPAQIVASSVASMFPSGVGIPYFRGICSLFSGTDGNQKARNYSTNDEYLYSPYRPYGYARLKGGEPDIDNFLYASGGATFQTWMYVPDLDEPNGRGWAGDQAVSALHRVVLGCENRGGSFSSADPHLGAGPQYGEVIKGVLMGFTRDRRLTQGAAPSNDPADNNITDGLIFHMTPTQSINTSSISFLAASANAAYCPQDEVPPSGYHGIFVDTSTTVGGIKFNDVSSSFMLVTVTLDYTNKEASIWLNDQLMKTESIITTFGSDGAPNIPSMVDSSSFLYESVYDGVLPFNPPLYPPQAVGQTDFWYWNGPQPRGNSSVLLTPWIIGGGYTDGMTTHDLPTYVHGSNNGMNFMGGIWGGKKSGLYGHLGSVKLYNRPLTLVEITKNYNAQRGFFENIRI
jgi:hypothetical protein